MRHRSDHRRLGTKQTQALHHPLRLRILEVAARERGQPPSVEMLMATLATTPGYEHIKQSEVSYHRARLLDAELLPVE